MKIKIFPLILIICIFFFSCSSAPKVYNTEPEMFKNEDLSVEFTIGINVYFLKITNHTDLEVFFDKDRISIISISQESRSLNVHSYAKSIPPNSYVVLYCDQRTFFEKDINEFETPFVNYQLLTDKDLLYHFLGDHIRLFIPYTISDEEKLLDFDVQLLEVRESADPISF